MLLQEVDQRPCFFRCAVNSGLFVSPNNATLAVAWDFQPVKSMLINAFAYRGNTITVVVI